MRITQSKCLIVGKELRNMTNNNNKQLWECIKSDKHTYPLLKLEFHDVLGLGRICQVNLHHPLYNLQLLLTFSISLLHLTMISEILVKLYLKQPPQTIKKINLTTDIQLKSKTPRKFIELQTQTRTSNSQKRIQSNSHQLLYQIRIEFEETKLQVRINEQFFFLAFVGFVAKRNQQEHNRLSRREEAFFLAFVAFLAKRNQELHNRLFVAESKFFFLVLNRNEMFFSPNETQYSPHPTPSRHVYKDLVLKILIYGPILS